MRIRKNGSKNLIINFKKIIIAFIFIYSINYYFNKYNNINELFYENNIDFSNYFTDIKTIAIYLPDFYSNNKFIYIRDTISRDKDYYQPRLLYRNYISKNNLKLIIKKQIELAKSHGIYGFAIYYYWFSGKTRFNIPLTLIYKNKRNFHYMLIWKYEKSTNENNKAILEEKYEEKDLTNFIKKIKKYLIDKLYIKINQKPLLGIYNIKDIPNIRETVLQIRKKAREFEIGEIFIISCLNGLNISEIYNMNIFDGAYKLPPKDLIETKIKNTRENYTYYYSLFYSNIFKDSKIENFVVFKGIMLGYNNSAITKNNIIFGEYSPELFYKINKLFLYLMALFDTQIFLS